MTRRVKNNNSNTLRRNTTKSKLEQIRFSVEENNVPQLLHNERKLRELFDALIRITNPKFIGEIGTLNGDDAVRFADIAPNSYVDAFEASPHNYQKYLISHIRKQHYPNLKFHNAAVCDKNGYISFNILETDESAYDWRIGANSLLSRNDDIPNSKVKVPAVTLDSFYNDQINAENTFALWIDVEGASLLVLEGAQKVLERTLFLRIEVEWQRFWKKQPLADDIYKFLEEKGFTIIGDSKSNEGYGQSDILALNKRWVSL